MGGLLATEMTPEAAKDLKCRLAKFAPRTWRKRAETFLVPLSGFVVGPGAHPLLDRSTRLAVGSSMRAGVSS